MNNIFTVNPTTILTVRYGFNRFPNYDYNSSQGFNIGSLGFSPGYAGSISPALAEFPVVGMSTLYSLGDSGDNGYYDEYSYNFNVAADKYIGRHSLKAGFDYRKLGTAGYSQNYPTGSYTFNSDPNYGTSKAAGNSYTGVDLGDLLTGYPYQRQADTDSHFNDTINYYGAFAQDDFRLNSKTTLNFGLRWEREDGVQEQHNALITGFNTSVANVLANDVTGISPKGAVEYAGLGGKPHPCRQLQRQQILAAPRRGLSVEFQDHPARRLRYLLCAANRIGRAHQYARLFRHNQLHRQHESGRSSSADAAKPLPEWTDPAHRKYPGHSRRTRPVLLIGRPQRAIHTRSAVFGRYPARTSAGHCA